MRLRVTQTAQQIAVSGKAAKYLPMFKNVTEENQIN
jgi:hypothetical protein